MQWLAVLAWILFLALFYFMWQTYVQIMHWRKATMRNIPLVVPKADAVSKPDTSDLMLFLKQQFADTEHFTQQQSTAAAVVVADTSSMTPSTTVPSAAAAAAAPATPAIDAAIPAVGGTLPLASSAPSKSQFDDSGFQPLIPTTLGASSDVQFFDRGQSSFSFL